MLFKHTQPNLHYMSGKDQFSQIGKKVTKSQNIIREKTYACKVGFSPKQNPRNLFCVI